jgi:hypothetical protein
MIAIATPVLIAIVEDIEEMRYDLRIILAPISLAWILLILVFVFILVEIKKGYSEIKKIIKLEPYNQQNIEFYNKVRGRNAASCLLIKQSQLVNKFPLASACCLFFFFLGIFLKVYILDSFVSFTALSPISFAPGLIVYGNELLDFYLKNKQNQAKNLHNLQEYVTKHGSQEMITKHQRIIAKQNWGMLINIFLIPGFFYGFWVALCLRFDG